MAISTVLVVSGSAGFSTRDVWDGYCSALAAKGLHVVPYPLFSMLELLSSELVCTDILGKALDTANSFDCVIFTDGLYFRGRRARIPQSIRRAGIPTVLIATDDPYDPTPQAGSLYTHVFTNELASADDPSDYLPTATSIPPELSLIDEPKWHVSFVGTVFEDRVPLLLEIARFCEEQQLAFLIAGKFPEGDDPFRDLTFTDVRPGTISEADKWQIYADSQVVLNAFRETTGPAHAPNPRVFEVTAFGHAALLTGEQRSEVSRIFGDSIYEFDSTESACQQLQAALQDVDQRRIRVRQAQEITLRDHLYGNRAESLIRVLHDRAVEQTDVEQLEDRIAWVTGCGRTGSTWLSEMLAELPGVRRWHEPYFGRFFRHVHERPADLDRPSSFYSMRHKGVWLDGLRDMFFRMVRERYPQIGRHALIVKEINTPEVFDWIGSLFRSSGMILLIRDPFDVLDSYLDLQKPGSWNSQFGEKKVETVESMAERTAGHIRDNLSTAVKAYDRFPEARKLLVRYEDLLDSPAPVLVECGRLVGQQVSSEQAQAAVEAHQFEKYEKTGALQFRRHGRAGVWRESGNFTDSVAEIANVILGPLRVRLGYGDVTGD